MVDGQASQSKGFGGSGTSLFRRTARIWPPSSVGEKGLRIYSDAPISRACFMFSLPSVGGQEEDRHVSHIDDVGRQLDSVEAWERQVQQDQVRLFACNRESVFQRSPVTTGTWSACDSASQTCRSVWGAVDNDPQL